MDKRDFFKTLGAAALAAPIAGAIASRDDKSSSKADAFERMLQTGILKAAWFEEPPFTYYDLNTKQRSGIAISVTQRFAEDYGFTIQWEPIANFALMGEDLAIGKYDAICASLINMPRGGRIDYAAPFVFVPAYAYVRADDTRITSFAAIDTNTFTIAGQDGTAVMQVAQQRFPTAPFHVVAGAELADMMVAVANNKADVAFMVPSYFEAFNAKNPGVLKPLASNEPLQIFSFSFGIAPGNEILKSMLSQSLHRMIVSGELERVFKQFDKTGSLMRPSLTYAQG